MALENARKLIKDMQTDEEFRTRCAYIITDLESLVQKVNAAGYDVTGEELLRAAEREYRQAKTKNTYCNKIFYNKLEYAEAMWPW